MITVTVLRQQNTPVGFWVKGHADFGEYGEDIVCAGVSAVVQTAILGIVQVLKLNAGVSVEEGDTTCILSRETTEEQLDKAKIVFGTMLCGLKSIQASYPKTLKFRNKEV